MERKIIDDRISVGFPVVRAMARAIKSPDVSFYDRLVFQAFVLRSFGAQIKAGSNICPDCGNLWSTPEKQAACDHKGGMEVDHSTSDTIRHWWKMAQDDPR